MNKIKLISFSIIGAIILIIILNPFYVLQEGKQAIKVQFGKPVGEPIINAGLHFKIPFIQTIHFFEKKVMEWDGYPNQIPTKDKRYIWVDTTARWKISNALRFYQSVRDERGGQARLDDIIDAAVRDLVTSHDLIEVIRSTNRILTESDIVKTTIQADTVNIDNELAETIPLLEIEAAALETIKLGREKLRKKILEHASDLTPQYGIELIDVRIKRINYVDEVKKRVYERMIAERKRAAEQYRSEGRGSSAEIEGRAERELRGILSEAYKTAQEIEGSADAEAARIYAETYQKNPDFYNFIKTLQTYHNSIDKNSTLILSTDSVYYKLLKQMK